MLRRLMFLVAAACAAVALAGSEGASAAPARSNATCIIISFFPLTWACSTDYGVASGSGTVFGPTNFKTVPSFGWTATAVPATGWKFDHWSGGPCDGQGPSCVWNQTAVAAYTILGSFAITSHKISVSTSGTGGAGGSVTSSPGGISCGSTCSGIWNYGTAVTLTANPNTGSQVGGWSGACSGAANTCTITIGLSDVAASVAFVLQKHQITVTKNGTGHGSVKSDPAQIDCGSACAGVWDYGTAVTLTATPDSGSTFGGWSGPCTPSGNTCKVTIGTSDAPIQAAFQAVPVKLTVARNGNGTVSSAPNGISCGGTCSADFGKNTTVTLTATPGSDSFFTGWSGGGCGSAPTCTVTMDQAKTVTANFKAPTFSLSPGAFAVSWKVSLASGSLAVKGSTSDGADLKVDVTAPDGTAWPQAAFTVGAGSFTQTIPLPATLSLRRQPGVYKVTVSAASHGIALAPQTQTVVLKAPPEGVISAVVFSATPGGDSVDSLPAGTKEVYVKFIFAAKPKKGPLKIIWTLPDGSTIGTKNKPISGVVSTFVKSTAPLKKGTWHVILKARGKLVGFRDIPIGV